MLGLKGSDGTHSWLRDEALLDLVNSCACLGDTWPCHCACPPSPLWQESRLGSLFLLKEEPYVWAAGMNRPGLSFHTFASSFVAQSWVFGIGKAWKEVRAGSCIPADMCSLC